MLHYRSYLLQTLETLILLPLMLMGVTEQKQHVLVEIYSSYVDSSVSIGLHSETARWLCLNDNPYKIIILYYNLHIKELFYIKESRRLSFGLTVL